MLWHKQNCSYIPLTNQFAEVCILPFDQADIPWTLSSSLHYLISILFITLAIKSLEK